jgi:hypothetical protein
VTQRRGRRYEQLLNELKEKDKIMGSEVDNTSSPSVENSPWKGLGDCRVWELAIAF